MFAPLIAGLVALQPLSAQVEEDEWYDPTDWFDGNNIESDDTYNGYYDYGYVYDYDDDWGVYDAWGDDYWEPDYYDSEYWDDFAWNDTATSDSTVASTDTTGSSSQSQASSNQSQSQSGSDQLSPTGRDNATDDAIVYTYVLWAEPIASDQQASSSTQQSGQQQSGKQPQIARLNGTIEGVREMNLQRESGAAGKHTVVKVKLDNGQTTVVSLGRSSQLGDLNLQKGDKIQAIGTKGSIGGETVFVAHSLKAKGETISANPAIRLNASGSSQSSMAQSQSKKRAGAMTGSSSQQKTIQGEVASVSRAASSAGQNGSQHTLVNLRLESGQDATVDLGPAASPDRIGLDEGDNITVRGREKQVNGRQVVVADLLKIDGEKVSSVSR